MILATDGSDNSLAAEQLVATWPIFAGDRIDVVSVAESAQDWDGLQTAEMEMPAEWWIGVNRESRQHHERLAVDATRRLAEFGHITDTITPAGDAAHQIVRIAQEHGADLIVLGTRGNTGLRRLVLGSVARNVLLHADSSVLIVPQQAHADG